MIPREQTEYLFLRTFIINKLINGRYNSKPDLLDVFKFSFPTQRRIFKTVQGYLPYKQFNRRQYYCFYIEYVYSLGQHPSLKHIRGNVKLRARRDNNEKI